MTATSILTSQRTIDALDTSIRVVATENPIFYDDLMKHGGWASEFVYDSLTKVQRHDSIKNELYMAARDDTDDKTEAFYAIPEETVHPLWESFQKRILATTSQAVSICKRFFKRLTKG